MDKRTAIRQGRARGTSGTASVTHYEALQEIQRIIAAAMPPDSGATVSGLLGDISGPLAAVGLDPISDVQDITDAPAVKTQKTMSAQAEQ